MGPSSAGAGEARLWPPDRVRRVLVALGALAILAYMTYEAFGFGTEPRRAPLVVGVPVTIMALVLLVREIRGTEPVSSPDETSVEEVTVELAATAGPRAPTSEAAAGAPSEDQLTTFGAAVWIAVLATTFLLFGFLVTTLVFPVLFMRIYGGERWPTIAVTSVSVFAVTYAFFILVLEIQVYRGIVTIPGLDAIL